MLKNYRALTIILQEFRKTSTPQHETFIVAKSFLHVVMLSDNAYCDNYMFYFVVPWVACASSPCDNGGTCVDVNVDTFICMCRDGYFGDTCQYGKKLHILPLLKNHLFFCCVDVIFYCLTNDFYF